MKEPLFYKIIRPLLFIWFVPKFKPRVINREYVPKKGKVLLAGNHTHNLDCFLLGYTTRRCVRFVAKDELMKDFKGVFFKMMGIIPVNRKIHDKSVIPTCVRLLNKGAIVGIHPEGTINKTDDIILPFKKGVIVMSLESNTPIIPFAITGKYRDKNVCIRLGKPYYPKTKDVDKEIEVLEDKVISLLKVKED